LIGAHDLHLVGDELVARGAGLKSPGRQGLSRATNSRRRTVAVELTSNAIVSSPDANRRTTLVAAKNLEAQLRLKPPSRGRHDSRDLTTGERDEGS